MNRLRSAATVILAAAATVGGIWIGASPASAWYGPFVFTSPSTVQPGSAVQVQVVSLSESGPVQARLDAIDGKVLATFTPDDDGDIRGTIPIPADTPAGVHTLVFTQFDASGRHVQMPLRAMVTVTAPSGAVPVLAEPVGLDTTDRPATLSFADDDAFGVQELLLIGFGAAGIALFLAGMAAMAASRSSKARSGVIAR